MVKKNYTFHIFIPQEKEDYFYFKATLMILDSGEYCVHSPQSRFQCSIHFITRNKNIHVVKRFIFAKTNRVAKGSSREKVLSGRRSDVVSSTGSTREHNWSHFHTDNVPIAISTHFPLSLSHFGLIVKGVRPPLRLLRDRFRNVLRF